MNPKYPPEWPEVARQLKERHGWKCERCGHPHETQGTKQTPDKNTDEHAKQTQ